MSDFTLAPLSSYFAYCPRCGTQNMLYVPTPCHTCGVRLRPAGRGQPWAEVCEVDFKPWAIVDLKWPPTNISDDFFAPVPCPPLADEDVFAMMRELNLTTHDPALREAVQSSMGGFYRIYRERDGLSPIKAYDKLLDHVRDLLQPGAPGAAAPARRTIKLFLDDLRSPPDETWTVARTAEAAKALLDDPTVDVECASLDCDMGECDDCANAFPERNYRVVTRTCPHLMSGFDLVQWMVDEAVWPRFKPAVHSANEEYKLKMIALIEQHFPKGVEVVCELRHEDGAPASGLTPEETEADRALSAMLDIKPERLSNERLEGLRRLWCKS